MDTAGGKNACLVYISPAGTTRKVSRFMAAWLERRGYTINELDLGRSGEDNRGKIEAFVENELPGASLLVVGSPCYADHVAYPVGRFLESLPRADGVPALAYTTFGGVSKGVTLVQMAGALQKRGYRVKGAAKVLCVHSLFFRARHPLAHGHPGEEDWRLLEKWLGAVEDRLERDDTYRMDPASMRPESPVLRLLAATVFNMRVIGAVMPLYRFCSVRCRRCGACQDLCPTGRLDILPPPRGRKDCLYCLECVRVCPGGAFDAPMWMTHAFVRAMRFIVGRWEDQRTEYYI